MNRQFTLRLGEEIERLANVRASKPETVDAHIHLCDVESSVVWSSRRLAELLSLIAAKIDRTKLNPVLLFQSARERLGLMPSSIDDVVYLLNTSDEDPVALYLFAYGDSMPRASRPLDGLTEQLASLDSRWVAMCELVDATGWDSACKEHANVLLMMRRV